MKSVMTLVAIVASASFSAEASSVLPHMPNECPSISGDYFRDSRQSRKTFKTEKTSTGIHFTDTGVNWIIDGTKHSPEETTEITYVGSCLGGSVMIDLYRGTSVLGQMTYSVNDKGEVVLQTLSFDGEPSETEVWSDK